MLNEDLRDRTSRATDTTKFLAREVQKLRADNAALEAKIAQLRVTDNQPAVSGGPDRSATTLTQLKQQLLQASALYSDRHPTIQSLKKLIAALEQEALEKVAKPAASGDVSNDKASLEALVAQQEALQKNIDVATAKLDAARLGESLERDQQSEKLEVIEQPTTPQEPIKPNRLKVSALAVLLALMTGAGLTFVAEMTDKGIRRPSDILGVVDSQLIVSIPYIVTLAELRRRKLRIILAVLVGILVLAGTLVAAYYFLPPLDLMIAKARVGLFR
jgi:uncharacterized protein involved in exopolysaccharide biosynthesis